MKNYLPEWGPQILIGTFFDTIYILIFKKIIENQNFPKFVLINVFFSDTIFNSVSLFFLCIAVIKKQMRFFFKF